MFVPTKSLVREKVFIESDNLKAIKSLKLGYESKSEWVASLTTTHAISYA